MQLGVAPGSALPADMRCRTLAGLSVAVVRMTRFRHIAPNVAAAADVVALHTTTVSWAVRLGVVGNAVAVLENVYGCAPCGLGSWASQHPYRVWAYLV
jgi:hypothetical protein